MALSKIFTASLMGAMSLSGALASRELNQDFSQLILDHFPAVGGGGSGPKGRGKSSDNTSTAICKAVAIGYSEVDNDNARAEAAVDTAAYMCGTGEASAEAIAQATASAFALAVADAAVSCELSGDSTGSASAYARAEERATVWLEAYAEAAATAVLCDKCNAFIYGWGYIGQEVFLKAVAEAKASIDATTTASGADLIGSVRATQVTIDEAVVTAYADALAGAKAVYDAAECAAYGTSEGCIYTEEQPEGACVECRMTAVSVGQIDEIGALAEAIAESAAYTCADHAVAYADTEVTAKAIAQAMALAVSYVHVDCESDEGGFACADVGTHIETSAKAVAQAYADAWAGAVACDECEVNVDTAVSSVETILVDAATSAYATVCVAEGTAWTVEALAVEIETGYLVAIAEAVAIAFSSKDPAFCAAAVTAATYVGP